MKSDRAPINEGPASEDVAAPALSGSDYDLLAGVYGDLSNVKVSVGYLHTVNPETGLEVVFVPGEALPAWAREEQKSALQTASAAEQQPAKKVSGRQSVKAQEAKEKP
jgi:hypothetical protein